MRVLVTGGYGFIGSHIADRFNKEGHQVFIIDNLSNGFERNISFKHKSYRLDVQDRKCDEIFKNNKFDVVIHLAAQASVAFSVADPYTDTNSNILGLINMLNLSNKYNVRKFIFASSAAVYGENMNLPLKENSYCDPTSPYGLSKHTGEMYCNKWYKLYGLNTLCFRFSNVYGPRQRSTGEGGVVSIFLDRIMKGKAIEVFGDGNQTRDFIYVEDVADAIYKSVYTEFTGVANLSSGTEISINNLTEVLRTKLDIKDIIFIGARKGDILRSCLDNAIVRRELDWVPMYSFEKGIEKTIKWYTNHSQNANSETSAALEVNNKVSMMSVLLPYIENILAFMLVLLLTSMTRYNADLSIFDFKLLYIILMAIMYGTKQSTISVALSTILYISLSLNMGRDLISLIYDPNSLLQISIYILVGIAVGYTIDRKNRDIQFKDMHMKILEEKNQFINELYTETRLVKEELQSQIVNSEDSFGKIYSITKEIDSLQPENIFNAAIEVIEKMMKSDSISIYTVNKTGQFLRLGAMSKDMGSNMPKSVKISDSAEISSVITQGEVYVNRKFNPDLPMIMAPIIDNNRVTAVVSIHNIKFENLTLYYQNLFKVVVGLISSSLSRAQRYEEATLNERCMDGTRILKWDYFVKVVQSKRQARRKFNYDYTILYLGKFNTNIQELSHELINMVREVDYISIDKNGYVYVLLANSNRDDAGIVIKRFESSGVNANIVNEEYAND